MAGKQHASPKRTRSPRKESTPASLLEFELGPMREQYSGVRENSQSPVPGSVRRGTYWGTYKVTKPQVTTGEGHFDMSTPLGKVAPGMTLKGHMSHTASPHSSPKQPPDKELTEDSAPHMEQSSPSPEPSTIAHIETQTAELFGFPDACVDPENGNSKSRQVTRGRAMKDAASQCDERHALVGHAEQAVLAPAPTRGRKRTVGLQVATNDVHQHTRSIQTEDRSRSLFIFLPDNPIRVFCRDILKNTVWVQGITFVIILSTIALCAKDPLQPDGSVRNAFLAEVEKVGGVVFIVEMILKVVAKGLILDRESYLRDPWNILDFICTLSFIISAFPSLSAITGVITGLRALRLLVPLRALRQYPVLQILSETLCNCLPLLVNVFYLLLFHFTVFGIIGVQLFNGLLHHRCFYEMEDGTAGERVEDDYREGGEICKMPGYKALTPTNSCDDGQICSFQATNPHSGTVSFDNILSSFLTIFQAITLEGWTETMAILKLASGDLSILYMILATWTGAFLVMNMSLAVIYDSYVINKQRVRHSAGGHAGA
ncbi:hypothetical protein CYMTET_50629 [Cymbomonas tetramitiformis]|uniref:Ion transport domain-containing protein n=1 Tax=Cymbomonas tetramitiformis TaxID=36881 RepID=A0AAE0BNT8_9CHLO|nr:hypothetical protein CYMTET_50629 [Cymbomonas tetramitiformis]|eukprot:gene16042-19026_t